MLGKSWKFLPLGFGKNFSASPPWFHIYFQNLLCVGFYLCASVEDNKKYLKSLSYIA